MNHNTHGIDGISGTHGRNGNYGGNGEGFQINYHIGGSTNSNPIGGTGSISGMIPYGTNSQDRFSILERSIEDMKDLYQKDMSNLVSELQNKLNKYDIECIESKEH